MQQCLNISICSITGALYDVCILPYFILFFLFITYMSVVCLLSSHANCDISSVYLYACSVCLCLFACCVLWALLPEIKWMMMMIELLVHALR